MGDDALSGLVVEDLCRSFGATRAVDGLSFDAGAGEITALLGPNGAGKTTALRCIAGILRLDAGEVAILGRPSRSAAASGALSFLPEQPDLYPALTVAEHLRFVALAHRLTDGWQTRAGELAERFELTDHLDALPGTLSQGQRRKAALITALLHGAQVLLFDEPFNGLDPTAVQELRHLLVDLAADGAVVVVSTHGLAMAEKFVDRAVVMSQGRDRAAGSLDQLRARAGVETTADLERTFLALTGRSLTTDQDSAGDPAEP